MNPRLLPLSPYSWRSLQVRLTLLSLAVFLIAVWSLAGYAHLRLHRDMERMLGQQQLATVTLHATEINRGIAERMDTLEKVTRLLPAELMARPGDVQQLLDERPALPSMFTAGYFVTDAQGTVIASVPLAAQRIGRSFAERPDIHSALKLGKSKVGDVTLSNTLRTPAFGIAVPIKGQDDKILGALVGATDLGKPNFMDRIMSARYGQSGGYTLIDRKQRIVVNATEKSRVLESLPAPGLNPAIDRYIENTSGTSVLVGSNGVEMMLSLADVPVADWALSVDLPTQEAFAPIDNLANNITWATFLASLLAAAATWWLLRRQLAPVYTAFAALQAQSGSDRPTQPLPGNTPDEVGQLINGFNHLLSELSQREAALSESQQQLSLVASRLVEAQQLSQMGSWTLDLTTGTLHWSEEIFRIFELDVATFSPSYQTFLELIHPDDRERVDQTYTRSLQTRSPYEMEHRLRMKDGRIKWVQERCRSEFDAQGKPESSIGTMQDITERKRIETALADSRDLLMTVIEAIPMRVFWKDAELRYLGCNTAFARDAGKRTPSEMIGQDDYQMGWAAQADLYRADDHRVIAEGVSKLFYDEPQTTPEGQTVWLRTSKIPLKARNGVVFGILGIYEDISERKQAEEQIRKLSMVAEQSPESVVITNLAGDIEYVNASFVQNTGYSRMEAYGHNPRLLSSGLNPAALYQELWQHLSKGSAWSGELLNRRKNGSLYVDSAVITPLRDANGTVTHYVSVQQDITEQKNTANELERHRHNLEELVTQRTRELSDARQQADAANLAKSEFLANMSHEIRTPMNGVIGMVDILRQTALDASQLRMVDTINQSSMALLGLLNDILDFSKIEAGKLEVERVAMPLREVVEDVVQLLLSSARQGEVELELFVDPALPTWIMSDPLRLRQILLNLLGNALKFVPHHQQGRTALQVLPRTHPDGSNWLHMVVIDNGIGMSADVVEKLFQPFSQADASTVRRFGGTGLGLSITHRLVTLMRGSIDVQSAPGKGSEFSVELPLVAATAPQDQTLPRLPDLQGVSVLVVKPAMACWTVLQVYLHSAGAQLCPMPDMPSAQARLSEADQDTALLLDLTHSCSADQIDWQMWRDHDRVLWLVRQPGAQADLQGVEVRAQPLMYRELLQGVAVACGRLSRSSLARAQPPASDQGRRAPSVEEAVLRKQLILVAEDNETNRDVMYQQLRRLGYAAELAADGVQALAMWRSGRYALLLTDCHMPNLDGYDLTVEIRRNEPAGVRKPVIAVTANAMYGEAERCFAFGMDDYLSKPVRMHELARILNKWLPLAHTHETAPPALPVGSNAAAAEPASSVIWDPTTLAAAVGDNRAMLKRLLGKFLINAARQLGDIQQAGAAGDLDALTRIAHTLKSSARAVGAMALGEFCQSLEAAGRGADGAACQALCDQLPGALEQADERIHQYLDA
ncbi:MAG: PAS domain S-box protein [Rhodoferax sp.]|uniref:PAS domain S-box protein n=1 Tax=Rhodoferax sp. TaxID=50421 RepID=UPI001B40201A|nr:PAS domain S-box protein [Rhodoferax sp.]MBP9907133.1 PAS domain S-box protein [Rhodoferax sp.]